jgi:hypothetical protein
MIDFCTNTSAPGWKLKSIIDECRDFSNWQMDAHLAVIRHHFTFLRSAAHFWSCIANDTIRSDVIMSSDGAGAMYVASTRSKGKRGLLGR